MKRQTITLVAGLVAGILATSPNLFAQSSKGKVLLVASSTNTLQLKENKTVPTGYFLDELAVPAQALIEAGYEVVVATPEGNSPALDAHSVHKAMFHNDEAALQKALDFTKTYPSLLHPQKLSDVVSSGLDSYAAVYVPGGHAPMNDLMQDASFGKVLAHFHQTGKPTALLCHGPIAIVAALPQAAAYRKALVAGDQKAIAKTGKNWPYAGYRMTIYSTEEEKGVEKDILHGQIQFYVADALTQAGGKVDVAAPNQPFVVRDRELITGQNPSSDHAIAEALLKALSEPPVKVATSN